MEVSVQITRNATLHTAQKLKFSIKNLFSKCDQTCSFLRIWSHLMEISLMENFSFCAVSWVRSCACTQSKVQFRGGSRTAATSKVELFVIIVNGWKPLTIITKNSTLDVAAVLDPPLQLDLSNKILQNYLFSVRSHKKNSRLL